jgi:arsenate reductase
MSLPRTVLFLCTGNSARSIMAEAILNHWGKPRFQAYSAGSHPRGEVHTTALDVLRRHRIAIEGLRSKSWDEFAAADAPAMQFIFTVCDKAAAETCPIWPGHPASAHWGIEDPVLVQGTPEQIRRAFQRAYWELDARIKVFMSLPFDRLDAGALRRELQAIGHIEPRRELPFAPTARLRD